MTSLPTQTAKYWVEDFAITGSDIEYLINVLLENETPLSADEMAFVLMHYRIQNDKPAAQKKAPGDVYDPADSYNVGQKLTLSPLDDTSGEVISVRTGRNPDVGSFNVISIKLANGEVVEFAADLTIDHALNIDPEDPELHEGEEKKPKELFIEYGGYVSESIEEAFEEQDDLVRLAKRWFPQSLLLELNIGHMNLAEAVLDMLGGGPLSTPDIIENMGMFDEVNPRLAEFSLNYHLNQDERFDEVGMAGQVRWYLVRLEPEGAHNPPKWLVYDEIPIDPESLTKELRELELEIGDEHTPLPRQRKAIPDSVTITLTYPHLRAGTIPLSRQLRRMFPTAYSSPRIYFTIVDSETGEEIPSWVVRSHGYVYGLESWFSEKDIPIGGYLYIKRTEQPGRVEISYAQRKNAHVEWLTGINVKDGRVTYEEIKHPVGCDYDDQLIVHVENPEAVDELSESFKENGVTLDSLVNQTTKQLIQVSPQKAVHAKTIYSVINVVRRCPPGPIFSMLAKSEQFTHRGGGYWQFAEE